MKKATTDALTRREMLGSIFSKDSLKTLYGAWHGFNQEVENANKLTGDAKIFAITRQLNKKQNKNYSHSSERREKANEDYP